MSIQRFMTDSVTVQTLQGVNGYGQPQYGPAVQVACMVDDQRKMTRSKAGDEVVSTTTVYCMPADAAAFLEGSQVTVHQSPEDPLPQRVTTVMHVSVFQVAGMKTGHAEVALE